MIRSQLEIDADVHFQRRVWTGQRIGWFFFAGLIITALLGFFGGGPVSRASVQGSGLGIEYERFARFQKSTQIRLALAVAGHPAQVELSRRYFDAVQIEEITPEPLAVESANEWLIYQFSGRGNVLVTFRLRPQRFGSLTGTARLAGAQPVQFRQFIYP